MYNPIIALSYIFVKASNESKSGSQPAFALVVNRQSPELCLLAHNREEHLHSADIAVLRIQQVEIRSPVCV